MQSARDKLGERLGELQDLERSLRQQQITSELLEIVTGADATA